MFLGEYQHSLDVKGRVILPVAFRGSIQGGLVLTKGQDNCLAIYPTEAWQRISDRLQESSRSNKKARDFLRVWYASARREDPDKQGRITIPEQLREFASLDREIAIIGVGDRAEIWDRERWERARGSAERVFTDLDESDPDLPF